MAYIQENFAEVMPGLRLSWGGLHPDGRVPVLLVPGYADSWRFWLPMFPYLPDWLRVFALSPRGHGTSDAPATGYTVADNAQAALPASLTLSTSPRPSSLATPAADTWHGNLL
ncbi:alpha/beta fold hydrolase [Arthrobacter psychrolactophilus]